jgi:hypothetical protein
MKLLVALLAFMATVVCGANDVIDLDESSIIKPEEGEVRTRFFFTCPFSRLWQVEKYHFTARCRLQRAVK